MRNTTKWKPTKWERYAKGLVPGTFMRAHLKAISEKPFKSESVFAKQFGQTMLKLFDGQLSLPD